MVYSSFTERSVDLKGVVLQTYQGKRHLAAGGKPRVDWNVDFTTANGWFRTALARSVVCIRILVYAGTVAARIIQFRYVAGHLTVELLFFSGIVALHHGEKITPRKLLKNLATYGYRDVLDHMRTQMLYPFELVRRPFIIFSFRWKNGAPNRGNGYAYVGIHKQFGIPGHVKREFRFFRHSKFTLSIEVYSELLEAEICVLFICAFKK